MKTDLQIAQEANLKPITSIANELGIKNIEPYGNHMAKVVCDTSDLTGKLVLVTAITPTKAGEGKSTTTVGLVDSLNSIGVKAIGAMREPSMGPVFGIKGGAAGGGYAQVVPMEDINLHFTGDMHAITSANNLISATIDNHIYHGNELEFDLDNIVFQRCLDMNDRALRNVEVGSKKTRRNDSFNITVASEIMAILCLSKDMMDFKERVERILCGYDVKGKPNYLSQLGISGAVTMIMKQALKPNLVQTLENNPFFVHGGPFANIAHGCNSLIATQHALSLGEVVVTEAGFGADLGAEKFCDIKCRVGDLQPDCVVIVATIRALKLHGQVKFEDLNQENVEALIEGCANLEKHIDTVKEFGLPYVVCINRFLSDTEDELSALSNYLEKSGHRYALSEVFEKGSLGGQELAHEVMSQLNEASDFNYLYEESDSLMTKVEKIAQKAYGASSVEWSPQALEQLEKFKQYGWDKHLVCMAKTPVSLSDNDKIKGAPKDFVITIRELRASLGAGFIVVLTGNVMTMPGLPKKPAALNMDIDSNGKVEGLF